MEYYLAMKRNKFESVLVSWMNQEPVIQSEVSQMRKIDIVYEYIYIYIYTYGISKDGTSEPICRAGIETQI